MKALNSVGSAPLTLEHVERVARGNAPVALAPEAQARIAQGRAALERALAAGRKVYGVNTGVGGNIKFDLAPDEADLLQHNIMRHLSCATGQPLPDDVVRAATLLRIVTFATGCSAVRPELVEALVKLLNAGVTPVVPRYGSVGASGDLMPSAYIARVLIGMGEAKYKGKTLPASEALRAAGLTPMRFAQKEGLALINGTTFMTAAAALIWRDATSVLRALLSALALAVEALEVPTEPYAAWVQAVKGHPGQIAVAEFMRGRFEGSRHSADPALQSCYSLRCGPQGLGPVWEALEDARPMLEREINSANDNPLIDPETGTIYRAGNFYGGHISRLLDTWKIDFAIMANWGHSLMAVLVDDRFNRGLPANLVPEPGVNSGLKGMQLSVTSLTCAIRQLAGPSSIHSLPTETYNQDVVSLGMHSAVTALDSMECLRNETAMILLASAQAVELRGKLDLLGAGNRQTYEQVRALSPFLDRDRPLEHEVAALAAALSALN
ncbi:MAG: aromatic amino acid lyase family protein [Bryobacterales bacterium]|nr:aromatic amino acid lyase family protein [Bryobacterales bacterium]